MDVVAFDSAPPLLSAVGTARGNRFFNHKYTEVGEADSVALFDGQDAHASRALLMIYPESESHNAATCTHILLHAVANTC